MKIEKKLLEIIPDLSGTVLGIGIHDENILEKINNSKKIENFDVINQTEKSISKNEKKKQRKMKKVHIKKLHKVYKKKSITDMICCSDEIEGSIRFFIRESIRLGKNRIYFFGTLEQYQIDDIIKKYKRYPVKIKEVREEGQFFLVINIGTAKYHFLSDKMYMFLDAIFNIIDVIGDGLLG